MRFGPWQPYLRRSHRHRSCNVELNNPSPRCPDLLGEPQLSARAARRLRPERTVRPRRLILQRRLGEWVAASACSASTSPKAPTWPSAPATTSPPVAARLVRQHVPCHVQQPRERAVRRYVVPAPPGDQERLRGHVPRRLMVDSPGRITQHIVVVRVPQLGESIIRIRHADSLLWCLPHPEMSGTTPFSTPPREIRPRAAGRLSRAAAEPSFKGVGLVVVAAEGAETAEDAQGCEKLDRRLPRPTPLLGTCTTPSPVHRALSAYEPTCTAVRGDREALRDR
jgi:hypothetical protein